jgi:hypothetical protein
VFLATLPQELFAKVDGEIDGPRSSSARATGTASSTSRRDRARVLFHGSSQIHCRDAPPNDDGFIDLSDAVSS